MVCLGFKPGAAGWKARTNPLSYPGTRLFILHSSLFFVVSYQKGQSNIYREILRLFAPKKSANMMASEVVFKLSV